VPAAGKDANRGERAERVAAAVQFDPTFAAQDDVGLGHAFMVMSLGVGLDFHQVDAGRGIRGGGEGAAGGAARAGDRGEAFELSKVVIAHGPVSELTPAGVENQNQSVTRPSNFPGRGGARVVYVVWLLALAVGRAAAAPVDFSKEIKPILESSCLSCHGEEKPKGGLRLTTRAMAVKGGENGTALVPGKPGESPILSSTLLRPDDENVMPPKGVLLTKEQTDLIKAWVEQGAEWPDGTVLEKVHRVDFAKEIQPLLELNCVACHRDGHAKGKLRLDVKSEAFKGGDGGPGIIPGHPEKSPVYTTSVVPEDDDALMPPKNKGGPLAKDLTELLRSWIEQGASWPEGVTLTPKKLEQLASGNEAVTVAEIHASILAHLSEKSEADMKRYEVTIPGTDVTFEMMPIPAGEYVMGSPETEKGRQADEGPQHRVKVSPFWMGKCEVTWNEFELFMYPDEEKKRINSLGGVYTNVTADAVSRPTKPYVEMSFGMGKDGFPAISMTHHAANKYCEWLSARTGQFFRLPTEAEWEYACRAGSTTSYSFGDDPAALDAYAWYGTNSDWKYQKVGKKKPNAWGLHDMHGNVAEWVLDQHSLDYYQKFKDTVVADPWNRATQPYPHVARGGSWDDDPDKLRSAARRASHKDWKMQDPQLPKSIWFLTDAQFLGFRVVRPLAVPAPEVLDKYWTSGTERD